MMLPRRTLALLAAPLLAVLAACGSDSPSGPLPSTPGDTLPGPRPGTLTTLETLGRGAVASRFTAEVWVQGTTAYTTTWGTRGANRGNAVYVWDVAGATPVLVDSMIVEGATTLGDVQATDDGRTLVVATERLNGSIVLYDLADARHPRRITRYQTAETSSGVHTAAVARVGNRNYAFLSIDAGGSASPARLVIVDIQNPAAPTTVHSRILGDPFVHDVLVRDGVMFTGEWDAGIGIWDVGGAGAGGTPSNPVRLSSLRTVNGSAHNIWWFHDPSSGGKRYAFVGEEGPASTLASASGDVHVVDVSDLRRPVEVAFFHVPGAGAHNFSMDEARGVLYAAFYNGGVRALAVRGDLGQCTAEQRAPDGRCDLEKMGREVGRGLTDVPGVYVWGVHFAGESVYASDMPNGLWKVRALTP